MSLPPPTCGTAPAKSPVAGAGRQRQRRMIDYMCLHPMIISCHIISYYIILHYIIA